MTELSISAVERRSGVTKQPEETLGEYLARVGERADLPPEDIAVIVDHANRQQFSPEVNSSAETDQTITEFLQAIGSIKDTSSNEKETPTQSHQDERQQEEKRTKVSSPTAASGNKREDDSDSAWSRIPVIIVVCLLVLSAIAGGAALLNDDIFSLSTDESGSSTEDGATPSAAAGANSTQSDNNNESEATVVTSAAEAEGALEVTDMLVDGEDPEEEFIEFTNVGEVTLDMSDWTVRDRENGGAVDAGGVDPATFPEGFTLEPGESVRLYTSPGENTEDTIYWGYYDRQNWHPDGDVIIVLDGDGNEVLRYEYGSPP